MSHDIDLKFLDKPEINQKIFPMAMHIDFENVPQSDPNADVYFLDVTTDIRLTCKFYTCDPLAPSILYFHGNDETALNQSSFGTSFVDREMNIFVTDYRGYGISDGTPSLANLYQDCHPIWAFFKKLLKTERYNPAVFIMGRSLGSLPAVELAFHYPADFKGLILESGSAMNFRSAWGQVETSELQRLSIAKFFNKDKIKEITIPTLVIHGDADKLMPLEIGKALYDLSGAKDKKLVIIPGGGHNDLRDIGYTEYYQAIEDFVKKKPKKAKSASAAAPATKTAKKAVKTKAATKTASAKSRKAVTKAKTAAAKTSKTTAKTKTATTKDKKTSRSKKS